MFSVKDLAVIENDYQEKGWSAYRIWKEHRTKNWNYRSVLCVVQKIRETGSTKRLKASGRPATAATDENACVVQELILSQEGPPGTH